MFLEHKIFLIAEIGKNFIQTEEERPVTEYLANAKELVRVAKDAGAHAVKFQTHTVEDEQANLTVVSPHFKGSDRYRWVSRNERSTPVDEFWKPLKAYCDNIGIVFFTTPMSRGAAKKIAPLDPALWKVGSGDILDFVCLDFLRRTGKPVILSSGMSTLEEVDAAVAFVREVNPDVTLLHCVSKYPCPPEDLHLNTIAFYKKRYDIRIGFSDHSIGWESAVAAVALGAEVVEKHFSLDRGLWGADHKVSMTPAEFKELATGVERVLMDSDYRSTVLSSEVVKKGMGTEEKVLQEDEAVFRPLFRKTLCASRDLPIGTVLGPDDLYAMRPQAYLAGLPSEAYSRVLGQTTTRAYKKFDPITE